MTLGFVILDPDQATIAEHTGRQTMADEFPDVVELVEIAQIAGPVGTFLFFHENLIAHPGPR